MKCSLCISYFLEEISSLSHSVVFCYFFALITEEGFLIYPCYSLKLHSNGYIFPFLVATYSRHILMATLKNQTDEINFSNVLNPIQSVLWNSVFNIHILSQPQILSCVEPQLVESMDLESVNMDSQLGIWAWADFGFLHCFWYPSIDNEGALCTRNATISIVNHYFQKF